MAVYKIDDVLECIQSMKKDGFAYIEITENEDEDDGESVSSLTVEAIGRDGHTELDFIDSVSLPSDYSH